MLSGSEFTALLLPRVLSGTDFKMQKWTRGIMCPS